MLEFEINNFKITLEPHHIDLWKAYSDEKLKNKMLEITITGAKESEMVYVDDIFADEEDKEFYVTLRPLLEPRPKTVKLNDITNSVLQF